MYNMNVKMKFIEMKAAGVPMYKIADEIGVHRITLMRWNKELAAYILIARQDRLDEMMMENDCIRLKRAETISRHLAKLYVKLDEYAEQNNKQDEYSKTLTDITKLTRLLLMENSAKNIESQLIDAEDTKNNENGISSAVYLTDKNKFDTYCDGDNSKKTDNVEEYKNNITLKPDEMLFTKDERIKDISDESPILQEIFNRSNKRNGTEPTEIITDDISQRGIRLDYAM